MEQDINFNENLTTREQMIFNLLIEGFSKEEIAKMLCVSVKTVRTHVANIYLKKGVDGNNAMQRMICSHYKRVLVSLGIKRIQAESRTK